MNFWGSRIIMKHEEIVQAVKKVREIAAAHPKKFTQTFDLAVSLKELDMKKPESKVKLEVTLPHGKGKATRYGIIADGELAEKAKNAGMKIIIGRGDLQRLAKDKKEQRKAIKQVDIFLAQPDLMVEVGKTLGATLGPRDKMPKPINPKDDLKTVFKSSFGFIGFGILSRGPSVAPSDFPTSSIKSGWARKISTCFIALRC